MKVSINNTNDKAVPVKEKGILVIVSGFSGSGKGALMKALLNRYEKYALSVSATTRAPREGEQHGREYFFVSKEAFEVMIREDQLIEYAEYVGNYYGTPREYVLDRMEAGHDVLLEIEMQGALKVKARYPDTLLIFVTPPGAEILRQRLTGRGTETDEVIAARMRRAVEESEDIHRYDYLLINDDLDTCAEELHALIQAQHLKMSANQEFIDKIRAELQQLSNG